MQPLYIVITLSIILICSLLFMQGDLGFKDVGSSLLALLSTFLGAALAFRLNEHKEKSEESRKQRDALNRALFVLIRQLNAIVQLKKNIESYKTDFELAFNMPALKPPEYSDLSQNIADLEFLISSGASNFLLNMTIEQERFHQAIESIRIRNEFYVFEVQKEISAKGINGVSLSVDEASVLLGERIFCGAMSGAKNARSLVFHCSVSLPKAILELRALAKNIFPGHKFLAFEED